MTITLCLSWTMSCGLAGNKGRLVIPKDMVDSEGIIPTKMGELEDGVLFWLYPKPMTNLLINLATNTAPDQIKVSTVPNEILRRFRTTSRDLHPAVIEENLLKYIEELKIGGHSREFRWKVLDAASKVYQRIWVKEVKGEEKVNRPEHSSRTKRRYNKLLGDMNVRKCKRRVRKMEKRVTKQCILYIPFTPSSRLREEVQKLEDRIFKGRKSGGTGLHSR